jgi:hypothetical protein
VTSPELSFQLSAALHRVSWLLHASLVEAKLRDLQLAVKAGFDPNQPRVPAGSGRESGRWTSTGGGTRVAQNIPPEDELRRGGDLEEETAAQTVRLTIAQSRRDAVLRTVHDLDPNWHPTPSLATTVEGQILAAESEAQEAAARIDELACVGMGPGPFASGSIPARGPGRNFTVDERREINRIGAETGCHTCGIREPGTPRGNFVPDHQPPTALNRSGAPQRLYPQCWSCSHYQGYWIGLRRRERP